MKLPIGWLHDYCTPPLTAAELAERLDLTGTEVERISVHGVGATEDFVVGKVETVAPHPDADRLSVCMVNTGQEELRQVVCGAPNVAAGQTVAVARPGAVLPDGTKLKRAKLRGVVSEGMILAEDELGIGIGHSGILVLEDGIAPGSPLSDVLPIRTEVLELEITPNRPDCLSIYGVAREVHAATGAELEVPPWLGDLGVGWPVGADLELAGAKVVVESAELCPRFTARVFENVTVEPSPLWLQARLLAAGQRPISNVVDITNYVMLVTGQPLHAFDLDKVVGKQLTVRCAKEGETVITLDGVERSCDATTVLVCDDGGPTAVAGIMGGTRSEVSTETTTVMLEVANWVGPNIHSSSLKLGLRSEASARFEKQLSPQTTLEAQALATRLLVELCGAKPVEGTIDVDHTTYSPLELELTAEQLNSMLGTEVPLERAGGRLRALGFDVKLNSPDRSLTATVPHYRSNDVTRPIDLIEEIARIEGLERIPATLPARRSAIGGLTKQQKLKRQVEDFLVGRGLCEVIGWSFTSSDEADGSLPTFLGDGGQGPAITLANPMSSEQSGLRTTLLQSLMKIAQHNYAQGNRDLKLFESGRVYFGKTANSENCSNAPGARPSPANEHHHIAALLVGDPHASAGWRSVTGDRELEWWQRGNRAEPDFFAAKALVTSLLHALKVAQFEIREASSLAWLSPGRAAAVYLEQGSGSTQIGWVGELAPATLDGLDLGSAVVAFELDLDLLAAACSGQITSYVDVIAYPPVKEDLSLVIAESSYVTGSGPFSAADLLQSVKRLGAPLVESVEIFDFYRSEEIGESSLSLGLRISYRSPDRTLTSKEITKVRSKIVAGLKTEHGAELRG